MIQNMDTDANFTLVKPATTIPFNKKDKGTYDSYNMGGQISTFLTPVLYDSTAKTALSWYADIAFTQATLTFLDTLFNGLSKFVPKQNIILRVTGLTTAYTLASDEFTIGGCSFK